MAYRRLRRDEIAVLEARGCRAGDWGLVGVAGDFSPGDSFRRVLFAGKVELGHFLEGRPGDPALAAGIEDAVLRDVRIGDGCRIRRANLAGVWVGGGSVVEEVGEIVRTAGAPPFAHNARANVLAEDGARSVPLWRRLSAPLAHILCHLQKLPAAEALESVIRRDVRKHLRLPRCRVGTGCRIVRCGRLADVWLGDRAVLEGVSRLENCWLAASAGRPVRLGAGVVAEDSVFLAGSEIGDGVSLSHCLAGEGVRLENGFAAGHSLFFANSHFALGEALAVLAGPFAVSHHKATLVLACQCLFNNFGGGSNSSNHHFKLGPRHGGVLRRGVNCGSDSYIFWPSDIGAFSTVIGRHPRHLDTAAFPFSLLLGGEERSLLIPGANVFSAGGFRDAGKWRERERRQNAGAALDPVNPAALSPYVVQALDRGVAVLRRAPPGDLAWGGAVVPAGRRLAALELYGAALTFYLGERLLAGAGQAAAGLPDAAAVLRLLAGGADPGEAGGDWSDWGGMLLSGRAGRSFLSDLEEKRLLAPEAIERRLREMHAAYGRMEAAWVAWRWRQEFGDPDAAGIAGFFRQWRAAALFRRDRLLGDLGKEFNSVAAVGFGVETPAAEAFARIRGRPADAPLAAAVREETEALLAKAANIV
ncbi:MAG: DUF4954 family protein [Planctomycetota bacterium]|jgi:hypothetical protein|nr:DUF4954 family protein [Planctomycetota bacterium]